MWEFRKVEIGQVEDLQSQEQEAVMKVQESEAMKQLREKMLSLWQQKWLEESLNFIKTLPEREQKNIQELFSDKSKIKNLSIYIEENGFPNSETYEKFKKGFFPTKERQTLIEQSQIKEQQTQVKEQQTQVKEQQTQVKEWQAKVIEKQAKEYNLENISLLKNIEKSFGWNIDKVGDSEVKSLLIEVSKLDWNLSNPQNKELFDKVSKELLENNWLLEKTLQASLQIDLQNAKNGTRTSVYQDMARSLSSFDPSLRARVEKFELQNNIPSLQNAQINATLGKNGEKRYTGDYVFNNDRVAVDISKIPPEAFISSEGWYKIPLDMPVREFYPATVKFEQAKQKIEPQLKAVNSTTEDINQALGNMQWVENQEDKKAVVDTLKNQLRGKLGSLYDELNIQGKKDINDIVLTIKEKQKSLQNEFMQARDMYYKDLSDISQKYAESQQKEKEALKWRLNFISSIGFDVIPQYITDMILSEVNRGAYPQLSSEIGMTEKIHIAEGNFWVKNEDPNRIAPNEKTTFIKLVNKMASWSANEPISVTDYSGEFNTNVINKADLREKLASYGVFPNKEKWDIEKIRKNMQKGKDS